MSKIQRYASNNAVLPPEGPLSYRFPLDFSKATSIEVDMTGPIVAEELTYVSGAYVDNYDNPAPLEIIVANSLQRVRVPAGKSMYVPLLITGAASITCNTPAKDGLIVPVYMVNFPVWPYIIG